MIIILSHKTHNAVKAYLKKRGHALIFINDYGIVYPEVSHHADIFACRVNKRLFVARKLSSLFSGLNIEYEITENPAYAYPGNILLNACTFGRFFMHNLKYTDKRLLEYAKESGLELINVRQGYTKCSCAVVGQGIITADRGIYKELKKRNIDTLLITEGNVSLPGFDYGFFGGACGAVGDELIINGDLDRHPDADKIKEFAALHGFRVVSFSGLEITDIGSIIAVL